MTAFAAVINPMLSSRVLPAPANAEAERMRASPIPFELMAKWFEFVETNFIFGQFNKSFLLISCAYLDYTQVRTGSSSLVIGRSAEAATLL